ncbi:hypothetical protein [Pasteurella multocida]|uniref:hypothetical protein n=1 Tax=Pasteurella multocida TaxID=747 RepID=UPI00147A47AA|nr:hypothetical protein [Pasteurella multocida]NNI07704.1 hypothetical protein [Pasteurella multocida]NNI33446.1 hypothetical protein [Pasteurella multocida]
MCKLAKSFWFLPGCWVLAGCDLADDGLAHNYYYREICVDGVIYLRSPNGNLTPKINTDFYPYQCPKEERNNG